MSYWSPVSGAAYDIHDLSDARDFELEFHRRGRGHRGGHEAPNFLSHAAVDSLLSASQPGFRCGVHLTLRLATLHSLADLGGGQRAQVLDEFPYLQSRRGRLGRIRNVLQAGGVFQHGGEAGSGLVTQDSLDFRYGRLDWHSDGGVCVCMWSLGAPTTSDIKKSFGVAHPADRVWAVSDVGRLALFVGQPVHPVRHTHPTLPY
eukprot:scaffold18846_cov106-Isochrysis_galbana.AAC.1